MDSTITIEQLAAAFRAGLSGTIQLDAALDLLLAATGGNVVGMWRRVDQELRAIGFRYDKDFPRDVAVDFPAATGVISLEQKGLGIVHATLTRQPAVALLPSLGGLLPGSGGWLERFGSQQSLSMPILRDDTVVGVLALASRFLFNRENRTWTLTEELARELATLL